MKRFKKEVAPKEIDDIMEVFCRINELPLMRRFFEEIFTAAERDNIALRWHLMQLLAKGVPQRKISSELGISLCKITRGSKILKDSDSITKQIIQGQTKLGETNRPEDIAE